MRSRASERRAFWFVMVVSFIIGMGLAHAYYEENMTSEKVEVEWPR
jgi:disulfide bond formation protein DsbB